jgi:hypothetical protein
VERGAQHRFDQFVRVRIGAQVQLEQLDVAENHRKDVVEVVRDAAGELSHRFHLLRLKQRLARLLERLICQPELGDVVRDAVQTENLPVFVAEYTLGDDVGLCPGLTGRHPLERLRFAVCQHFAVVGHELSCRPFGVQLEIVLADDFGRRTCKEAGESFVNEYVPPFEILDENRVRRGFDDRLQNVVVRDAHRDASLVSLDV